MGRDLGGGSSGNRDDESGNGSGSVLAALLASPAAADLVLWVLLRVHAKLSATPVYRRVMWAVEQQHAVVVTELKAVDARFTKQQAQEVSRAQYENDGLRAGAGATGEQSTV
eukprot:878609-Pelagomonas_calceolata.AAC.3